MKSFEEIKSVYEEEKSGFDVEKEHPEKFIVSLELANLENRNLLKEYNINLKPSDWIVLSIEPEILEKTILRARDLGFLEAYQQTPSFLKQDVDAVIKRIAELDHLGVPYKSEKGKYQSFLFSKRGFDYVLSQVNGEKKEDLVIENLELKELADRVMETFAMEDKKDEIYNKVALAEKEGLGLKDTLMAVFKEYSDNLEYLSDNIDEILASYNELAKGRVA
jgi:hypothetical protein